jgi:hypothetical protein
MASLDLRAISASLFLPLLYWTGAVIAISLFGYPGVVCMTPVAWLLALPVGMRVPRESASPVSRQVIEAAVGGGLLGLWQGVLFIATLTAPALLPGSAETALSNSLLLAAVSILAGVPVTAGLAAWTAWMRRERE